MNAFKELLSTIDCLLGPSGCPWDKEQTLQSMRHSLLEETYEAIEAIDLNENQLIEEELGDLLFNLFFLCRLAEKEGRFTLDNALQTINAKLIRRHPHVFDEKDLKTSDEVLKQWDEIKQKEKNDRPSALDGIPKDLPALMKAGKIGKKLAKCQFQSSKRDFNPEEQAGETLFKLVKELSSHGIKAEQALSKRLTQIEKEFRQTESSKK